MEYLLTFLYTAKTTITQTNVQMLLEAANLFQIDLLKTKCTEFMYHQLDPCNCLGMKAFADAHGLEKLGIAAECMILEKFMGKGVELVVSRLLVTVTYQLRYE